MLRESSLTSYKWTEISGKDMKAELKFILDHGLIEDYVENISNNFSQAFFSPLLN